MYRPEGRAATAPTLSALLQAEQASYEPDEALLRGNEAVVEHREPRRQLATPRRVPGMPSCSRLTSARITEGTWLHTGEQYRIVDSWRTRATAHRDLEALWTGETRFMLKYQDNATAPHLFI